MTALQIRSARATAMPREMFTAWRATGNGKSQRIDAQAGTLDEFVSLAASHCSHKETLFVLRTDTLSDKRRLFGYAIKQESRPSYVDTGFRIGRYHKLKAHPAFEIEVRAFDPVEPWRWTPGCDAGGASGIVEVLA